MAAILSDQSKRIDGDIAWSLRNDTGPWAFFQIGISSEGGWPLFIKGGYNPLSLKVQFSLIHQAHGRIYGLCLGSWHNNRNKEHLDSPHKHRWTETDPNFAYAPSDIMAAPSAPVQAWQQFCQEAQITHAGTLAEPPPMQGNLL